MSAPSLMCRTAILVIALVVLMAGGAHAAQGPARAKTHRKTTTAASSQATRHAMPAIRRHHITPTRTRTRTRVSMARKPTPHETGRTAGRAMRRELAQKRAARRNIALHEKRSRVASQPESEGALHSAHAAPAMEVASEPPVFLLRPAQAEEPAQTRNDGGISNEGMDFAEREALRQGSLTAEGDSRAQSEDAGAGTHRIAPPAPAMPDAETPDARTEEASLRIPRGVMPAPLLGSHESLERQNTRLDAEGLERIEDESDLEDRIAHKLLVPIPVSSALAVNAELPATHRYCRPWTARFLADLAREHDAAFHRPLEVSSAVRTMEYQKRLMEINGNAAAAEGDIVSPHLTGATIDIAKDGLSRNEIAWMRRRLLALQTAGKIDVEEEFRQACFHITVYKSYAPPRAPRPATQAGSGSKRHKAAPPTGTTAAQGL